MAYNNGFPMTYQQMYPQFQQYQQQAISQPTMTPPTIHAEIIQVGSETEAANYPVAAGATQMFITRDDSAICIKTAYANGQSALTVFDKRKQQASSATEFVTRDEFERRMRELSAVAQGATDGRKTTIEEESEK